MNKFLDKNMRRGLSMTRGQEKSQEGEKKCEINLMKESNIKAAKTLLHFSLYLLSSSTEGENVIL